MDYIARVRLALKATLMWLLLCLPLMMIGWMFQQPYGYLIRKSIILTLTLFNKVFLTH